MDYRDFYQPENYVNRELSWIDFNGRVLEEAASPTNPLLERANFLGITQSNVDEFFMVRVASDPGSTTDGGQRKGAPDGGPALPGV